MQASLSNEIIQLKVLSYQGHSIQNIMKCNGLGDDNEKQR